MPHDSKQSYLGYNRQQVKSLSTRRESLDVAKIQDTQCWAPAEMQPWEPGVAKAKDGDPTARCVTCPASLNMESPAVSGMQDSTLRGKQRDQDPHNFCRHTETPNPREIQIYLGPEFFLLQNLEILTFKIKTGCQELPGSLLHCASWSQHPLRQPIALQTLATGLLPSHSSPLSWQLLVKLALSSVSQLLLFISLANIVLWYF